MAFELYVVRLSPTAVRIGVRYLTAETQFYFNIRGVADPVRYPDEDGTATRFVEVKPGGRLEFGVTTVQTDGQPPSRSMFLPDGKHVCSNPSLRNADPIGAEWAESGENRGVVPLTKPNLQVLIQIHTKLDVVSGKGEWKCVA